MEMRSMNRLKPMKKLAMLTAVGMLIPMVGVGMPQQVFAAEVQQTAESGVQLKKMIIAPDSLLPGYEADMNNIAARYMGRNITVNDLNTAVTEVTNYYREHGYPAATAYLPAQANDKGEVQIAVAPGKYGKITVDNQSRLSDDVINRCIAGLHVGDVIDGRTLETAIYNIKDLKGVKVGAVMSPGANDGETDVVVRVENGKSSQYMLYAENHGSKAAGRYRYGILGDWYNIGGHGEHIGVNGLISNSNQKNIGIRYEMPFGHSNTKVGFGYSHSNYELGSEVAALGVKGNSDNFSLFASTPLWKTTNSGLNVNYGLDYRKLKDEWHPLGIEYTNKRTGKSFHVGADGYQRWKTNAMSYDVTLYYGDVSSDEYSIAGIPLPTNTLNTGKYTKATANVNFVQSLTGSFDMVLKLQGQQASRALDSSERLFLGGANGVRAYPQGEAAGDNGYLGSIELRYHTKVEGLSFGLFYDTGHVNMRDAGIGTTLSGWGIGVNYSKPNEFFARIDYARRIGLPNNHSNDADAKQRIWFIAGMSW